MSIIAKLCHQFVDDDTKVETYTDMYLYGKEMIQNLYVETCQPNREFFKDILDNLYYIKTRYYFGIEEDNEYAKELIHQYKTAMTTLDNEEFCGFMLNELRELEDIIGIDYKEHIYLYKNKDFLIGQLNSLFTGCLESLESYYKASCDKEAFSKIHKLLGCINLYQYNDESVKYPLASVIYLNQKVHLRSRRFADHQLLSSEDFSYEDDLFKQIEDIYLEDLHRKYEEDKLNEKVSAKEDTKSQDEPVIHVFDHFSSPGLPDKEGNYVEPFSVTKYETFTPSQLVQETKELVKDVKTMIEGSSDKETKAKPNKDPDALVTPANPVIPSDNTRHGKDGVYISKAVTHQDGVKIVNTLETKVPVLDRLEVDLSDYKRIDTVFESSTSGSTSDSTSDSTSSSSSSE